MAYRQATVNSGGTSLPTVSVPAGVQAGDTVIIAVTIDDATIAPTDPAGFTVMDSAIGFGVDVQSARIYYKKLTGADSGSYAMTGSSTANTWVMSAFAFSGRDTVGNPVNSTQTFTAQTTSPVSVSTTGLTAVAGDDLLVILVPDPNTSNGYAGNWTQPTGYTKPVDQSGSSGLAGAYKENVTAGATGSLSSSFTLSAGSADATSWVVRIPVLPVTTSSFIPHRMPLGV